MKPIQQLHSLKNELAQLAEAGDIQGWREKLPRFQEFLKGINGPFFDPMEWDLEVKKYELTLLMKAGDQSLRESTRAQGEASLAERNGDSQKAQEWSAMAKKFQSFGQHLHNQVLQKTRLMTVQSSAKG